jgi:transcriptional regulator with XRE-family HTH domain
MERFELSMLIALRIKARLRQLRWNQGDFAEAAQVQGSEVSKWLTGHHNFTLKTLDHIQRVLRISFFNFDNPCDNSIPCTPCEFSGLLKS